MTKNIVKILDNIQEYLKLQKAARDLKEKAEYPFTHYNQHPWTDKNDYDREEERRLAQ